VNAGQVMVMMMMMMTGELHDCLSKLVKHEVDVSTVRITLDIIGLTLPPADDTGSGRSAASASDVNRTASLSSQLSFPGVDTDPLTPDITTPSKTVTAISE